MWEATADLIQWIDDHPSDVRDKSVLDLGCGSGLVGVACLQAGASQVTFHDFNQSVIDFFTKANVSLNLSPSADAVLPSNAVFASGNWDAFTPSTQFDVILSSETVYQEQNFESILNLIKRSLCPDGKALVAAKTYYFGVGGGSRSFEEFLARDSSLRAQVVRLIPAPVPREILQLSFP